MKARSVAESIIEQLHQFGVEYIFGVSGDAILHLLDSLSKQDQIKFIPARHESAAGFMASAYAKLTGKLGVCMATSGPGMANLLNGLGDAYADQVPVLAITGQVPTKKIGTHSKQYIDQQRFIEPLAAYTTIVSSPDAIVTNLGRAVTTAIKQKTVAHLSIPKDLFAQAHYNDLIPSHPFLYHQPPNNMEEISKAAAFLSKSRKPMILAGKGAKGCREEILNLAEKWGAGIVCSLGAKGIIPESCERMAGGVGEGGSAEASELLKECDGLLIVGAMWYPKTFMSPDIPFVQIERESDHIHVDKNLYTALLGDAKQILPGLTEEITAQQRTDWVSRIQEGRRNWLAELEKEWSDMSSPISPALVMKCLSQTVAPEAIIALDTGDNTVWFNRSFQTANQEILFSGTWRTLGFGLPAANAAQLIYPQRQVIAIAGDGGFGMNLGELATLAANRLPIKIVVLNNHCLAMEKNKMEAMGLTSFGNELYNPDFSLLAQSFGIEGMKVSDPNELQPALAEMMGKPHAVLLEVISSTVPTSLSKVKAAGSE